MFSADVEEAHRHGIRGAEDGAGEVGVTELGRGAVAAGVGVVALHGAGARDAVPLEGPAVGGDAGLLDVCRKHFPRNRPSRFRLYGFDDLSLLDFDAYPIASIGYDKAAFVHEIVRLIAHPESFTPGDPPVVVQTRFIPRATA